MELKPGVDLLGDVDEIFYDTYDIYEPVNDCKADNCFISTVSIISLQLIFLLTFFPYPLQKETEILGVSR